MTFPPSDDDQGETLRIVTEAVELGEGERLGGANPMTSGEPQCERPGPAGLLVPAPNRSQEESNDQTDEVP